MPPRQPAFVDKTRQKYNSSSASYLNKHNNAEYSVSCSATKEKHNNRFIAVSYSVAHSIVSLK